MEQYSQLVEKIANAAKITVEEVERKVEAKRAKLSGLVSKEGAAQIVAAELGINFEREQIKISGLMDGMKRANIKGKVLQVFPVRSYSKNGREGKVGSFVIADESASTRAVLWDVSHIGLLEEGKIKEGDVLEIWHGSVRNGELHLSSFGDIKHSSEKMENITVQKAFQARNLGEAKAGQSLKARAVIVQVFEPRYFEVCPECGKRVLEGECKIHGGVQGVKRALLNIVIDDGIETIRSVLFGEQIKQLGLIDDEIMSIERFLEKKNSILGEEKVFSGNVRSNALYNTLEFNIEKVEDIDINQVINELEGKASV